MNFLSHQFTELPPQDVIHSPSDLPWEEDKTKYIKQNFTCALDRHSFFLKRVVYILYLLLILINYLDNWNAWIPVIFHAKTILYIWWVKGFRIFTKLTKLFLLEKFACIRSTDFGTNTKLYLKHNCLKRGCQFIWN